MTARELLHVYYGLKFLEVVPADRNAPSFKDGLGVALQRRRQSQDSARDLRSLIAKNYRRLGSSATQLGCRRTGTGDGGGTSRAQVDAADPGLRASTRRGSFQLTAPYRNRKRLRQEIESIFAVKLCQETLRPSACEVKASGSARHTEQRARSERNAGGVRGRARQQPQTISRSLRKASLKINELALRTRRPIAIVGRTMQRNCRSLRHRWRCKQHPNGAINAGLLVFAPILLAIAQVLDPPEPRFAQWLASLLLGALNIEHSSSPELARPDRPFGLGRYAPRTPSARNWND